MNRDEPTLPRVSLNRAQWVRLVVVGIFVAFALGRVVPDLVRIVYPLHVFGYVTDGDGVVVTINPGHPVAVSHQTPAPHAKRTPAYDAIRVGDRIRIDRIPPFDRKEGLTGVGFTYDNPDRRLPVDRGARARVLHLMARTESPSSRFFAVLRIGLFTVSVGLGAMLFLMKPSIATGAFFLFCLGGEAPITYLDLVIPNPWRPIPEWLGNMLHGAARPALLLFAFCLIDGDADAPRERAFAYIAIAVALVLGTLHALGAWLLPFGAHPAESLDRIYTNASAAVTALTTAGFVIAFFRASGLHRARIAWIVVAFLIADGARLASDALFPRYIALWLNGILLSATVIPIVVVWVAVIRQRFFDVDFVVSRAIVYTALTAAAIGVITVTEELGTYLFYNNTDIAYGFVMAISLAIGATTGKIKTLLDRLVDRFIFRDRRAQRQALELIAGYILDAENPQDVYRALLADAAHALQLSFGGYLERQPDGDFALRYAHDWPDDCFSRLTANDELTRAITRSRGAMTFTGKDTSIIQRAFPRERLTFAAPVFLERSVNGIVVYGHNVSGLDLDPDEREHLVRVVSHASIALNAIELARYRDGKPLALAASTEIHAV